MWAALSTGKGGRNGQSQETRAHEGIGPEAQAEENETESGNQRGQNGQREKIVPASSLITIGHLL
jgi:hypothetical protein